MATDREYLKASFGFTVDGSVEIGLTSVNLSIGSPGWVGAREALDDIDFTSAFPSNVLGLFATMMSVSSLNWALFSKLRTFRLAAVGMDGMEQGDAKIFEDATPASGTNDRTLPQSTVVLSLRSGMSTGSANFGRMYLPHTAMGIATGTAQSTTAATGFIVGAAKTALDAINAQFAAELVTIQPRPWIMTNKVGAASKVVVDLAVGNVTDTQRRRRNQLTEAYSFAALA